MSYDYVETSCPLMESGSGTLAIGGSYFADVTLLRVGTQVTIVLSGAHTGAIAAEWTVAAADIGPGICSDTNVDAEIDGVIVGL